MGSWIFLLANLTGLAGFILPLLPQGRGASVSPLLFFLLVTMAAMILLADLAARTLDARAVALMGVLAAANALLRLLDNSFIVLPGGFSPIFLLIAFVGYLFGLRFGFLFGLLSLLVSALVTGGVGPWLPYQMMAAAWMGGGAAFLPHPATRRGTLAWLALYGLLWGFLYGFLLDLYAWPYVAGPVLPGLRHYLLYYAATSLWWDSGRAIGNLLLTLGFGAPLLRLLGRFRRRVEVVWEEAGPPCDGGGPYRPVAEHSFKSWSRFGTIAVRKETYARRQSA